MIVKVDVEETPVSTIKHIHNDDGTVDVEVQMKKSFFDSLMPVDEED